MITSSDVATPADTTEVIITGRSSTNSTTGIDAYHTITNGKFLNFQLFEACAESNSIGGSVVEIYDDPNGDLSVLTLISVMYVNGASYQYTLSDVLEGDGTRRIVLRRKVFSGSSREIFGRIKGFEQ